MYILIPKNNGMILSLSSVTDSGRCWYFCATPECTSDNRKNMNYNLLIHTHVHANKQNNTPHPPTPHPTFLFPGAISLIVELASKLKQCRLPF